MSEKSATDILITAMEAIERENLKKVIVLATGSEGDNATMLVFSNSEGIYTLGMIEAAKGCIIHDRLEEED